MEIVSQEYVFHFDTADIRAKIREQGVLATRLTNGEINVETIMYEVRDMTGHIDQGFKEYRFTITGTARPDPDGIAYQISINPEES